MNYMKIALQRIDFPGIKGNVATDLRGARTPPPGT